MRTIFLLTSVCSLLLENTYGFVQSNALLQCNSLKTSSLSATNAELEELFVEIAFGVSVSKPMGVIFGENKSPYFGLRVDDVEPGLNGGMAGLKLGDQLLTVNGKNVLGQNFDAVMGELVDSPEKMYLELYRGDVDSLYTILSNRGIDGQGEDDDDDEEEIVMDENYESPVRVNVDDYRNFQDEPINIGDVGNALGKSVGSLFDAFKSQDKDDDDDDYEDEDEDEDEGGDKKKGGFFGGMFKQETVQLDGDDATGLKGVSKRKK